MAKKTSCPITRAEFREHAEPVTLTVNGQEFTADVKEFSTGSLGWYLNGKVTLEVAGKRVSVQMGVNLTIVGSKELPEDAPAADVPQPVQTADAPPPAEKSRDTMDAEGPTE